MKIINIYVAQLWYDIIQIIQTIFARAQKKRIELWIQVFES